MPSAEQLATHFRAKGYPNRLSALGQVVWHRLLTESANLDCSQDFMQVLLAVYPKYPLGHLTTQLMVVGSEKYPPGQY